jgi:hypothetical protein
MSEGANGASPREASERPLPLWERATSVAGLVFVAAVFGCTATAIVVMLWRTLEAGELAAAWIALLLAGVCSVVAVIRYRWPERSSGGVASSESSQSDRAGVGTVAEGTNDSSEEMNRTDDVLGEAEEDLTRFLAELLAQNALVEPSPRQVEARRRLGLPPNRTH